MEYVLKTDALCKNYRHFKALSGLSMHVPKGAIYGFVGKNGAGKTTLIRLICGLQNASLGSYTLYGVENTDKNIAKVRRRMGAVVETPSVYLDMTARENMEMQYRIIGLPDFSGMDDILKLVGLHNTGNKKATINSILFDNLPFFAVITAMFSALYIGKEYGFGTIRNKLVAGHTRGRIYLSNYIAAVTGSLIIYCSMLAGILSVGIPLLGGWKGRAGTLFLYIFIGAASLMATAAVLTMLSMLSANRAVTAVLAIVLGLVLIISASIMYNSLAQPEMTSDMAMTLDGIKMLEPKPNPFYIGGTRRRIYEFLLQFLPAGQGILIANNEITVPVLNLVCSCIITVFFNVCGVLVFRKKDIK